MNVKRNISTVESPAISTTPLPAISLDFAAARKWSPINIQKTKST
jgi:hypothetical protein